MVSPRIRSVATSVGGAAVATALLSCGAVAKDSPGEEPRPAAVPAPAPAPRDPPRWFSVYRDPPKVVAELATASGKLLLTDDGRRLWADAAGSVHESGYRLRWRMGGILEHGSQLALVSRFGDVHVLESPLGPATTVREGLVMRGVVATGVGQRAIVAATEHGQILRSTDLGRSWARVEAPITGVPVGVALDRQGRGLLLAAPQALWLTEDDGQTWKRIASPPGGVDWVASRPRGVLAGGSRDRPVYLLEGHGFVPVGREVVSAPFRSRVVGQQLTSRGLLQVLRGEESDEPKELVLLQPDAPNRVVTDALPAADCPDAFAFGRDDDAWIGCRRDDGALGLWHRRGQGAWRRDGELPDPRRRPPVVGPSGWLLTGTHLRPGHGQPLLPAEPEIDWEHSLVADDVVHLLGSRRGEWLHATSSIAEPIPKLQVISRERLVNATLASRDGRIAVLAMQGDRWVSIDPASRGDTLPVAEPLTRLPPRTMRVVQGGSRGVACTADHQIFETADGGASWTEIKGEVLPFSTCPPVSLADRCTASGCQLAEHSRVGWQLGSERRPHATPIKPESTPSDGLPWPITAESRLACETSGDEALLGVVQGVAPLVASFSIGGGLRWATPVLDARGVGLVSERVGATRDRTAMLTGAPPATSRWSWHSRVLPEGAIVVRESAASATRPAPAIGATTDLRAELAAIWWKDGKASRTDLRVATRGSDFQPPVLGFAGGGALYRPHGAKDPNAYVLTEGGRVSRLGVPDRSDDLDVFAQLATGLFAVSADSDWLTLESSTSSRSWFVGGRVRHGEWDGRPAVGVDAVVHGGDWEPSVPFALALDDVADPLVVDSVAASDAAATLQRVCEPSASGGVVGWLRERARVAVHGPAEELPGHVIVRMRPRQRPCVVGYATATFLPRFAFIPADAPDRAALFRVERSASSRAVQLAVAPLRCLPAAPANAPR